MDPAEVEERLETLERVHVFVTPRRRARVSRRHADAQVPVRARALSERALRVAAADAPRGAQQAIVAALVAHYGDDAPAIAGRARGAVRDGARLRRPARSISSSPRSAPSRCSRFREALSLAERGLDGPARRCPTDRERQQLELGLQMMRGLALRSVKGWAAPELESTFARARALCQQLGDPPELFPVLWNLELLPHDPRRSRARARADGDADARRPSSRGSRRSSWRSTTSPA